MVAESGYLEPLAERVRSGEVPEEVVDRAVRRVLEQKQRLGLLEPGFADTLPTGEVDLDPPAHRALARLAEESVILLGNDGVLPLAPDAARIAVLGPNADDPAALMGCYSFANHVLPHHPGVELGIEVPTVLDALRAELPGARITHTRGCDIDTDDVSGFAGAVAAARDADVAVVVVGDRAGLFGRGTSGRLPVSLPRSAGAQPYSYLHPRLGAASSVTAVDTAPVRPFGFGLSYTTFTHSDLRVPDDGVPTGGAFTVSCRVRNDGDRAGADVVQLYGTDVIASVTRPVVVLLGYARVEQAPGASAEVRFDVPTHRIGLYDRDLRHVVEPGTVELFVGTSCADPVLRSAVELTGPVHEIGPADRRLVEVEVHPR
ncbi:fibronectin type III-like domain-contianing protein [Pseudonocardia sp. NPDC046786]|uniref:fibronectin type III-like domain-contianing protein n=1 Tax=Pseudonocardia sp. NPDC046786 TaxID=3155471 RepID=UPI00340E02A3